MKTLLNTLIIYSLLLLACGSQSFAQHYCGFDFMKEHYSEHESFVQQLQQTENRITNRILNDQAIRGGGMIYTIPVVFHVIHQNGSENIPDEQIENALEWLNDSFANEGSFQNADGVDIPIRFCLAHVDPDGNFHTGINHVESTLTVVTIPDQDAELKDVIRWDTEQYLNIWVVASLIRAVDNEGIVGNSTLPVLHGSDIDGIIVEAAFVGGSTNQTKVIIHEVGHYLGLYHTFEGGCFNSDCMNNGDHVCDTPPDGTGSGLCGGGVNSCSTDEDDESENNPYRPIGLGGLGDQPDMTDNYMDYSALTCYERYTFDQCVRMVASLMEIRGSLLDGDRCNPPCEVPIDVQVTASAGNIFLGENIFFNNESQNFTGATWYVDEVVASTSTDFLFTPDEVGEYFIELVLVNDDQGCSVEVEFSITVSCSSIASFISSGENAQPGETLSFENTSNAATEYQWLVDGEPVATTENFSFEFDNLGSYEICLQAGNGACNSVFCQFITVGTCSTGNEIRRWFTYVDGSGLNSFEFNSSGDTYSSVSLPYSEGKSTICDENGNLLFTSDCEHLYNANLEVTPNGDELFGGSSAREGALFVRVPGSDHLHYLFTMDHNENNFENGVCYNIIDKNLDGGLGDIVDGQKNIPIAVAGTETMCAIRHCNYKDFWLVYYNAFEEQFDAWLFTENGIADEPVVFPWSIGNLELGLEFIRDFSVSPKGDMFLHDNHLCSFDAATGEISVTLSFPYDIVSHGDFSASGKYLFIQTGEIDQTLRQINVQLPADEIVDSEYVIGLDILQLFADVQRTPSGEIFCANPFAGVFDVIHNPNLYGADMNFQENAITNTGFTNGLGNYYHAYISQQVFVNGDEEVCNGTTTQYAIYGCPEGAVSWSVEPSIPYTLLSEGEIELHFTTAGFYEIKVFLESECGAMSGSMMVTVSDNPFADLGPDVHLCLNENLLLDAGSGFESYLWSTGATSQTIIVSTPGIITVTVSDGEGCEVTDEIEILNEITPAIDLGPDFDICEAVVVLDAGPNFTNYTWQDGSTGQFYTVFEPGTYSVTATFPCEASDEIIVTPCHDIVGEWNENMQLILFPNPATDEVIVFTHSSNGVLQLFDATGRLVAEKVIQSKETVLDVSMLSSSVYTVVFRSHNGVEVARLVIE